MTSQIRFSKLLLAFSCASDLHSCQQQVRIKLAVVVDFLALAYLLSLSYDFVSHCVCGNIDYWPTRATDTSAEVVALCYLNNAWLYMLASTIHAKLM